MKTSYKAMTLAVLCASNLLFFSGGCAATSTRQSTGELVDDTAITAKVKTALIKDDTVKARDVSVETYKGTVQLSGFVDTAEQKARAGQIAAGIAGVVAVKNDIVAKTP
jgi:hyperosmotically inducible periplasmic protein